MSELLSMMMSDGEKEKIMYLTKIGNPTINNNVISNFSNNNYLLLPTIYSGDYNKIQLHTKIKTPNNTQRGGVFCNLGNDDQGIYISAYKKINSYVNFKSGTILSSDIIISANTEYEIDFTIDFLNSQIILNVNNNKFKSNFSNDYSYNLTYCLGYQYSTNYSFNGEMYLTDTYIILNDIKNILVLP